MNNNLIKSSDLQNSRDRNPLFLYAQNVQNRGAPRSPVKSPRLDSKHHHFREIPTSSSQSGCLYPKVSTLVSLAVARWGPLFCLAFSINNPPPMVQQNLTGLWTMFSSPFNQRRLSHVFRKFSLPTRPGSPSTSKTICQLQETPMSSSLDANPL